MEVNLQITEVAREGSNGNPFFAASLQKKD
jgi:hypothetical protein